MDLQISLKRYMLSLEHKMAAGLGVLQIMDETAPLSPQHFNRKGSVWVNDNNCTMFSSVLLIPAETCYPADKYFPGP